MKAVLIVDMPESCDKCRFHYNTYDENDCYVDKCELLNDMTIDGYVERYDGCPLKELPEKYEIDKSKCSDPFYEFEFEYGYNQCIDEIIGE